MLSSSLLLGRTSVKLQLARGSYLFFARFFFNILISVQVPQLNGTKNQVPGSGSLRKTISVPPKNCQVLKFVFAKIRPDSGLVFY